MPGDPGAGAAPPQILDLKLREEYVIHWCRGGSRYVEGGFQDIDFRRCSIISQDRQDLKDSRLLIFQDVPYNYSRSQRFQKRIFQDVLRFQKMIFRNVFRFQDSSTHIQNSLTSIQDFSNIFQMYSGLLRFQDHP